MASRAHREAVLERQREILARGAMSPEEQAEFDCARAWEMYRAEQRRAHQAGLAAPQGDVDGR
jgi:hypothetical protein